MSPNLLTGHWSWRPDWTSERPNLWWYAGFGSDPNVQQLARTVQGAINPEAPVDAIPGRWLHLSLAEVGYVADVSSSLAQKCARAAQRELAAIGPMTLTVGPVSAMPGALVLDVHAPGLVELHDRLLAAMVDTLASPPMQRPFVPHISVAYVRDRCTSEDVFSRSAIRCGGVSMAGAVRTQLTEIALVEVVRDRHHYRWSLRHQISLG